MNKQLKTNQSSSIFLWSMITLLILFMSPLVIGQDEDDAWPREIDHPQAKILIYQPQLESFKGNILEGRAAVSIVTKGSTEPVFGAVWIKARVETDRDERTVTILDIEIPNVRFPDASPEKDKELAGLLEQEIPKWEMTLSLDVVLADLELVWARPLQAISPSCLQVRLQERIQTGT